MYTVYVIQSISNPFIYTGLTDNPGRRLKEHNSGQGRSTKPYAPFQLIYTEEFQDRADARMREKYLKSTAGKNYLRKINILSRDREL